MTDLEKALQQIEESLKVVRAEDKCAAQDIQEVIDALRQEDSVTEELDSARSEAA